MLTAFTAEQHSFVVSPRAGGLWAHEMHKAHLSSAFVHHLPPWDLHPFLGSCVPLPFQQGAIKTLLPDLKRKRTPFILQKKTMLRYLTSSLSVWRFQFVQEEKSKFSFHNSVRTSQKLPQSQNPPVSNFRHVLARPGQKWD